MRHCENQRNTEKALRSRRCFKGVSLGETFSWLQVLRLSLLCQEKSTHKNKNVASFPRRKIVQYSNSTLEIKKTEHMIKWRKGRAESLPLSYHSVGSRKESKGCSLCNGAQHMLTCPATSLLDRGPLVNASGLLPQKAHETQDRKLPGRNGR